MLVLAESQHGVIARRQLSALGLGAGAIKARQRSGRLVAVHRGVYALGHRALRPQGRWMAAVLACGDGAVLSHRSAAMAWGLRPWSGPVELTVGDQQGCRQTQAAFAVHRSQELPHVERALVDGIPVTTVPRTLLDLAAVVPAHHLRRAVERAEQLELFDLTALTTTLAAHPRRRGSPALSALLQDARHHGLGTTRSDVEAALLQLTIDHRLPRPVVNRYENSREVDFRWTEHLLIVEVDGWSTHKTRRAFTTDRARDRLALREGWRVARFTATEVERRPDAVAAELRDLLGA